MPNGTWAPMINIFHGSEQLQGDLVHISEPVAEATTVRVELVAVRWLTNLLRGMFNPLRRGAEPSGPTPGRAPTASDAARSPDEWLGLKRGETPQRPDEGPSAYARRLYDEMPARFRERWTTSETLRVALSKQRRGEPQ
jgi:hypothetical protein